MIEIEQLTVRSGSFALNDISLQVGSGEYAVLMGKTGSGKTTLLEAICGLRPVAGGRIVLRGIDITRLKPAQRGLGFVPQEGVLFSTMTVRQHLGFALVVRKWPRARIEARVDELAALLRLEALLDRYPHGLSGGESQRVALGRALAASPGVLCLDEPLAALDDATREEMVALLQSIHEQTGTIVLHITHSQQEAQRLADRLFVIQNQGLTEQAVIQSQPADSEI